MTDQAPELLPTETPMSDHIARFWETLAEDHVRIVIDIRREHEPDSGVKYHWDGATFSNDVAKALIAGRNTRPTPAERPVPQVREAEHLLADIIANETYADNDGVAGISAAAEAICEKFEIHPLTAARPSDAAVAWRYRHKDTEGWSMLKNGRDPIEWLKQWTNTEYEVEALAPMRPEAADEIDRLRNQLVKAQAAVNFCEWLNGYFGGINRRDELTALEANSIRAKLYGEVYPPAPLVVTDDQGGKS